MNARLARAIDIPFRLYTATLDCVGLWIRLILHDPYPWKVLRSVRPRRTGLLEEWTRSPIHRGERTRVKADVVLPFSAEYLPFVPYALESILNQNFADCVVHLVADGADFDVTPLRQRYAGATNLRFYRNQNAVGPYASLNRIFSFLETDFVVVQDADDISLPNRVWRSVRLLEGARADLVSGALEQFLDYRSAGDLAQQNRLKGNPWIFPGIRSPYIPTEALAHGTLTLRKSAFEKLGGYAAFPISADLDLYYRAKVLGLKAVFSDQLWSLRRLHRGALCVSEGDVLETNKRLVAQSAHEIKRGRDAATVGMGFHLPPSSEFGILPRDGGP